MAGVGVVTEGGVGVQHAAVREGVARARALLRRHPHAVTVTLLFLEIVVLKYQMLNNWLY